MGKQIVTINLKTMCNNSFAPATGKDVSGIKQTVYLDILLCLNLFINYFILLAASKFTKLSPKRRRIVLGAAFGALCSLIILLPPLHSVLNFGIKMLVAAGTVFLTFGRQPFKVFLKNFAAFLLISFCFGGAMIALWFAFTPKGMVINNGAVYFNLSPLVLIVSTLICYLVLRLVSRLSGLEAPQKVICRVRLAAENGRRAEFFGKLDTGSSLVEPFSQSPVIVVDFNPIKDIVPESIKEYFLVKCAAGSEGAYPSSSGVRFVPFQSIGGEGILPAFKPKQVFIDDTLCMREIYIAVCERERLSGECRAIINTQCID